MGVYIVFVNTGAIELPLDHSKHASKRDSRTTILGVKCHIPVNLAQFT